MTRAFRTLSYLAVATGLAILLVVAYQVWGTDVLADREQERIGDGLRDDWATPIPPLPQAEFGDAFAFLHIPAFGPDWKPRAVIEGTDPQVLADGPGHFVNSAMPGEVGNFAMAGHRVGEGSPFLELDELDPGDAVVVETVDHWYVYRIDSTVIVDPGQTNVVAPTPGGPLDGPATAAWLTMTTCHPEFSDRERLVVHALLDAAVSKSDAPQGPDALYEV
ncbi:class E sortase [Blastococcus sp. SYSU DS0510]